MAGKESHFIVDMWTNKVLNKVISGVESSGKSKTTKTANASAFTKEQTVKDEIDVSLVGPMMWSPTWEGYYTEPVNQSQVLDASAAVTAPKRRANNFTASGRLTAPVLYQELSKTNIDAHRLVDPYDYGEQLGPAEHIVQPFKIDVHPQVGFLTDIHGHLCDSEVIGLLAGKWDAVNKKLYVQAAFPCAATERHEDFGFTDVELDPEAEWQVREAIGALNLEVVGWYHSHPKFKPSPSVMDIFNQQQYQLYTRDESTGEEPFVGLIVSTYDASLSSAVSEHQWFTVIPYTPPVRRNSIIDDDVTDPEPPARGGRESSHKGNKEDSGPRYMPMRMQVTYQSVHLETAFLSEAIVPGNNSTTTGKKSTSRTDKPAAPFTAPLMKSLMALRVESETPKNDDPVGASSSATSDPAVATAVESTAEVKNEDKETEPVVLTKRKYTPRRSKAELEAVNSNTEHDPTSAKKIKEEVARKTLSAKIVAGRKDVAAESATMDAASVSQAVTTSALKTLADLTKLAGTSLLGRGKKSAGSKDSDKASTAEDDEVNSLKGSSSAVSLESREARNTTPATASLQSAFVDPMGDLGSAVGIAALERDDQEEREERAGASEKDENNIGSSPAAAEDGAEESSYWHSLVNATAEQERSDAGEVVDGSATTGVTPSVSAVTLNVPEFDNLATNYTITKATADTATEDATLASRLQAEEQAQQAASSRRPAREIKKVSREDYVDTLEVTKGIRRQNMDNVRAAELKIKQKAAAERAAKQKAVVVSAPTEDVVSSTSKKQKTLSDGDIDLTKSITKAPAKGKKGAKEDPCVDCLVPPFSLDSTLCSTIPVPRKKPTAKDPIATAAHSEFTSIILALQDPARPCSALARDMLCRVLPAYRGLVLVVISMGMYYSRSPRRVDWSKSWKGHVRIEKVKASAAVWLARMGLVPSEAVAVMAVGQSQTAPVKKEEDKNNGAGEQDTVSSDAVVSTAHTNSNGQLGTEATSSSSNSNSTETSTVATTSTNTMSNTHYLTEWVGQYLLACWEDYSRLQNRKRKA